VLRIGFLGILFQREEGETIGVLVVAAADAVGEAQDRDGHENEADEDLKGQDFQRALLGDREKVVASTTVIELTGITIAHTRGERRPA
jgi:hypothetical protein